MNRLWLGLGAALGLAGVALGAAGTHALAAGLDAASARAYDTAVRYQLVHAAALVALAAVDGQGRGGRTLHAAGWCLVGGTALFCGALYVRALAGPLPLPAAPAGGALLMAGWLLLLLAAVRRS